MIYDQDWDWERQQWVSSRKVGRPLGENAPHIPNKAERKALTRMMQKSGQTEEEVRESLSNRRALAAARKQPTMDGKVDRYALAVKRSKREMAKRLGCEVWQIDQVTRDMQLKRYD